MLKPRNLLSCSLSWNFFFSAKLITQVVVLLQVIAKFMALMYSYLNISLSKNIVPDEIKGREIHHSFPVSLFLV